MDPLLILKAILLNGCSSDLGRQAPGLGLVVDVALIVPGYIRVELAPFYKYFIRLKNHALVYRIPFKAVLSLILLAISPKYII